VKSNEFGAKQMTRARTHTHIHTHTHTHTHTPFDDPLTGTTRVSRHQKRKTDLDFTEARDSRAAKGIGIPMGIGIGWVWG